MKHLTRARSILLVLCVMAAAVGSVVPASAVSIVEHAITFKVKNLNRSVVPCATDSRDVEISGTVVGPRSALVEGANVALYLHGVGLGEFYWRFEGVPGYNFARTMASRGHISVVIDRLGYGASTRPDGLASCFGGQADIAHQIVDNLRTGKYELKGAPPIRFGKVALVGHSAGGFIAEIASASFRNIDALVVISYADQYASDLFVQTFLSAVKSCEETLIDLTSDHYGYFGTLAQFRQAQIHPDMERRVSNALFELRRKDPCGDYASAPEGLAVNQLSLATITVPVLVMIGQHDAYFPGQAQPQADRFVASQDRSGVTVPEAGHLLALERTRDDSLEMLSKWLTDRRFAQ